MVLLSAKYQYRQIRTLSHCTTALSSCDWLCGPAPMASDCKYCCLGPRQSCSMRSHARVRECAQCINASQLLPPSTHSPMWFGSSKQRQSQVFWARKHDAITPMLRVAPIHWLRARGSESNLNRQCLSSARYVHGI